MQRTRRTNPYPFTWELPLALLIAGLFVMLIGLQAGRSLANVLAGGEWAFVERAELVSSVPELLQGDAGAGLPDSSSAAPRSLLWSSIIAVEILIAVCMAVIVEIGLQRWGPSRIQGMATREEAHELLGVGRLRRHAGLIRPDLYGGLSRRRTPSLRGHVVRTAGDGGDRP